MLLGIELPNRPEITDEDWARLAALRPDTLKCRPYHRDRLPELAQRTGVRHFLLRPDGDGTFDPANRSGELKTMVDVIQGNGWDCVVELDNEPNITGAEWGDRPAAWLAAALDARAGVTKAPVISPGLAVLHNDEAAWYAAMRGISWDGHGFHFYWEGDAGRQSPAFWDRIDACPKPVWVTELGDSSNDGWDAKTPRYLDALTRCFRAGAVAVYPFILGGTEEWSRFFPTVDACAAMRAHVDALNASAPRVAGSAAATAPRPATRPEPAVAATTGPGRTADQQTLIDVVNGWATRLGLPTPLTPPEQSAAAHELADVKQALEREFR